MALAVTIPLPITLRTMPATMQMMTVFLSDSSYLANSY